MENMIMLANMDSSADDNQTFTHAMQSPDSEKWVEMCAVEVASLLEHRVHGVKRNSLGGQFSTTISSKCKGKMGWEYL